MRGISADKFRLLRRVGVIAFTAVIAIGSARNAVTSVARSGNPQLALKWQPDDPLASVALYDQQLLKPGYKIEPATMSASALESLTVQSINPGALRLLGLAQDELGHHGKAVALFGLASRQSRRDFTTNAWLIEEGVRSQKISTVLAVYDRVLRTNLDAPSLYFPILSEGLADPEISRAFVPYIRNEPAWLPNFIQYGIEKSANPAPLAITILRAGGLAPTPANATLTLRLLDQLMAKNEIVSAQALYRTLPGITDQNMRAISLTQTTTNPRFGSVSWKIVAGPGVDAAFDRSEANKPQIRLSVGSGERGVAATKLLFLPAGTYLTRGKVTSLFAGADGDLSIRVRCANPPNIVLFNFTVGASTRSSAVKQFWGVPSGCPAQYIEIAAAGGNAQQGSEFVVEGLSLARSSDQQTESK